ncbi:MAG: helix-turn-helix transcriptional regulator [Ignavibacteriales bacterium]|nr:helix-turn-helix transcriptional regulator [Ignavibacteriales bacterium]
MLKYNFERLFKMKGISKPAIFLMEAGFPKDKAYRIINHKVSSFSPNQIEKLCAIFECTPNDLMEWTNDDKIKVSENHPLQKLLPAMPVDLRDIAKGVPIDKMEDFARRIEEIKKSFG